MADWTLAPALFVLRAKVDDLAPKRSKASDGTIGDAAHAATVSDHNPNRAGVVCAWDATADVHHTFGENLANAVFKDKRTNYVIFNRRKKSRAFPFWRPYFGKSPHLEHVHISLRQDPRYYNDRSEWSLPFLEPAKPLPVTKLRHVELLSNMDLRSAPTTNPLKWYSRAKLGMGSVLIVVAEVSGWLYVQKGALLGWIKKDPNTKAV